MWVFYPMVLGAVLAALAFFAAFFHFHIALWLAIVFGLAAPLSLVLLLCAIVILALNWADRADKKAEAEYIVRQRDR